MLKPVQILEEQKPGGLLRVIELTGTASILPEDIINVLKSLFEHTTHLCRNSLSEARPLIP